MKQKNPVETKLTETIQIRVRKKNSSLESCQQKS